MPASLLRSSSTAIQYYSCSSITRQKEEPVICYFYFAWKGGCKVPPTRANSRVLFPRANIVSRKGLSGEAEHIYGVVGVYGTSAVCG